MVSKNGTHNVKTRTEKRTKLKLTNCKVDKIISIWVSKLAGIAHLVALAMLGFLALNTQLCHALKPKSVVRACADFVCLLSILPVLFLKA